jgi:hypothetical protein
LLCFQHSSLFLSSIFHSSSRVALRSLRSLRDPFCESWLPTGQEGTEPEEGLIKSLRRKSARERSRVGLRPQIILEIMHEFVRSSDLCRHGRSPPFYLCFAQVASDLHPCPLSKDAWTRPFSRGILRPLTSSESSRTSGGGRHRYELPSSSSRIGCPTRERLRLNNRGAGATTAGPGGAGATVRAPGTRGAGTEG